MGLSFWLIVVNKLNSLLIVELFNLFPGYTLVVQAAISEEPLPFIA